MTSAAVASLWLRLEKQLTRLMESDNRGFFSSPVDAVKLNLPHYHQVIKRPMDFGTVQRKRELGEYADIAAMGEDIQLVFANAIRFNPTGDLVRMEAERLQALFQPKFDQLMDEWREKVGGGRPAAAAGSATGGGGASAAHGKKRKSGGGGGGDGSVPLIQITDANRPQFVSIYNELAGMPAAALFVHPVKAAEVPDYHGIIKHPKALMDIKMSIFRKELATSVEFDEAMQLIHDNCCEYNSGNTTKAIKNRKDAKTLLQAWRKKLKQLAAEMNASAAGGSNSKQASSNKGEDDTESEADDETASVASSAIAGRGAAKRPKTSDKGKKPAGHGASSSSSADGTWHPILMPLFQKLFSALKSSQKDLFEFPVNRDDFPEYYSAIARPICLDDIRGTLESKHAYDHHPGAFLTDIATVWNNCRQFNEEGSEPFTQANAGQKAWDKVLDACPVRELKAMEEKRKKGQPMGEMRTPPPTAAAAAKEAPATTKEDPVKETKSSAKEKESTSIKKEATSTTATAAAGAATKADTKVKVKLEKPPVAPSTKSTASATAAGASSSASSASATAAAAAAAAAAGAVSASSGGTFNASRCRQVLSKLTRDTSRMRPFMDPVSESDAPGYGKVVKEMMCVKTIIDKITRGQYKTNGEFARDVELIWKNCIAYNTVGHPLSRDAAHMRQEFRQLYQKEFGESVAAVTTPPPPAAASSSSKAAAAAAATDPIAKRIQELEALQASVEKMKQDKAKAAAAAAAAAAVPKDKLPPAVKTENAPTSASAAPAAAAPPPAPTTLAPPAGIAPLPAGVSLLPDPAFYSNPDLVAKLSQPLVSASADRLLARLLRDPSSTGFRNPVKVDAHIADYHQVIKEPMDLGTMKGKVAQGAYRSGTEFTDDLERIWTNAIRYNGPRHEVSQAAGALRAKGQKAIMEMLVKEATPATPGAGAGAGGLASSSSACAPLVGLGEVVTKRAKDLLTSLIKHAAYCQSFSTPIESSIDDFAKYKAVVERPMDLGKVQTRLTRNEYTTLDDFYDDVRLCFRNALAFHGAKSIYGLQAQYLLNEFEWKVKELEYGLMKAGEQAGAGGPKGKKSKQIIPSLALLRKSTTGGTMVPQTPGETTTTGGGETPMPTIGETPAGETPATVTGAPSVVSGFMSYPASHLTTDEHARCVSIIDKLIGDVRFGALFSGAVDASVFGLLDYFEKITRPMDLKLVKRKLAMRAYETTEAVADDVHRITSNCLEYYGSDASAQSPDVQAILTGARLLRETFDDLWVNYSKGAPGMKGKNAPAGAAAAAAHATPAASNLAPPSYQPVPSPLAATSGLPSALAVAPPAAPAAAGAAPSPPNNMTPEQYQEHLRHKAEKKEAKRIKKEKKAEKKRRRAEAGFIDVAGGDSAPGSPASVGEQQQQQSAGVKMEDVPRMNLAGAPAAGGATAPPAVALVASAGPRVLKIPKHAAAASVHSQVPSETFVSPKKLPQPMPLAPAAHQAVGPVPMPTKLRFTDKNTGAPAPAALVKRPAQPVQQISFAQRKRALEVARKKQQAMAASFRLEEAHPPPTHAAASTPAAVDLLVDVEMADAESSILPSLTPGLQAIPSLQSSPIAPAVASSSSGGALAKPTMHRAHSYLASMVTMPHAVIGVDGRRAKNKKLRKRVEKWRAMKERCERAQEQMNERSARLKRMAASEEEQKGDDATASASGGGERLEVFPQPIPSFDVPLYRAHGFAADPTGTLVRVMHTTLPPTDAFPCAIDQHILLFARPTDTDHQQQQARIQLTLNGPTMADFLHSEQGGLFEQWTRLKTLVDETQLLEMAQPTDLDLLRHPLTSSSSVNCAQDLSYLISLASGLEWQSDVGCYTHAVEFAGVQKMDAPGMEADGESDDESAPAADDGEDDRMGSLPSIPDEISYEDVLAARLADTSSDEEDAAATPPLLDGAKRPSHKRPFSGLQKAGCNIPDCQVTPVGHGRFFHRCTSGKGPTADDGGEARRKRRRLQATPLVPSVDLESTASQALVACTGVVIWSLPQTLVLRINGQAYSPTFEAAGVARPMPKEADMQHHHDEHERQQRQLMQKVTQQSRHERRAQLRELALYE